MCYNCGCGNPHDDMGHRENITQEKFEDLARKENRPVEQVMEEVRADPDAPRYKEMFSAAAAAWGQPEEEARANTTALLAKQLKKMHRD